MKLLVLNWCSYTQPDINECFRQNHINFKQINYYFNDKNHDDYFHRHFTKYLTEDTYDAVFSVNYFPLIAQVCYEQHVKYISWSYDNPLNVPDIERTLGYETNYVFLFDRIQAGKYQNMGYSNVYHLPLGVLPARLNQLVLSPADYAKYSAEISFVGKLYTSTFHDLIASLDDYHKGYLCAIAESQSKIYGYYFIDELLTDSLMEELNAVYKQVTCSDAFHLSREQLSYSIATNITHEERLVLLSLLAKRHQVHLYSNETHPLLTGVIHHGTANYTDEILKIYRASKINLNMNLKISQSGMPLRTLDIMGTGGFLFSNYQIELAENFIADEEIVFYTDIQEALDKATFYLKHDDIRAQIALNGQAKVIENFNYNKLLAIIFKTASVD